MKLHLRLSKIEYGQECPFCFKSVQNRAVKCRFCGNWLSKQQSSKKWWILFFLLLSIAIWQIAYSVIYRNLVNKEIAIITARENYLTKEWKFNPELYAKMNSVTMRTSIWKDLKEIVSGKMKNEEKYLNWVNWIWNLKLSTSDYLNQSVILDTLANWNNFKSILTEYNSVNEIQTTKSIDLLKTIAPNINKRFEGAIANQRKVYDISIELSNSSIEILLYLKDNKIWIEEMKKLQWLLELRNDALDRYILAKNEFQGNASQQINIEEYKFVEPTRQDLGIEEEILKSELITNITDNKEGLNTIEIQQANTKNDKKITNSISKFDCWIGWKYSDIYDKCLCDSGYGIGAEGKCIE